MKFLQFLTRWLPLFFRNANVFIQTYIIPAINVVEAIKDVVANSSDFKALLVKIYGDENAAEHALDFVTEAIKTLGIGAKCLEKPTPYEVVSCFIEHLKKQPKAVRRGIYSQLAAQIAKATSGEDIADHEVNTLVNIGYTQLMQKAA